MTKFSTKTSNPDPVYLTEKDGQRVRQWSADGKLDHVIDDDVRAWVGGKVWVTSRSGLEFVHQKFIASMIKRGDFRRDDRDPSMLYVTEALLARYNLPAPVAPKKALVERVSLLSTAAQISEGDRAAAAKRALDAHRADQEILRKGVAEPSPVEGLAVLLYVDDAKVGCGERVFLVRNVGPKVVRLFYAPLLAEVVVDRLTFDRFAKPYSIKAKKVLARMDRTAATFEKFDVEYSPKAVRPVMEMLMAA